jgi:hypothetical protein
MHKPEEAVESKQQETQILISEFMDFIRNSLKLKHIKRKNTYDTCQFVKTKTKKK